MTPYMENLARHIGKKFTKGGPVVITDEDIVRHEADVKLKRQNMQRNSINSHTSFIKQKI